MYILYIIYRSTITIRIHSPTGRKKCAQYWSDEGTMQYGGVRVTVDGILTFPDYCIRTLIVERVSVQFVFTIDLLYIRINTNLYLL